MNSNLNILKLTTWVHLINVGIIFLLYNMLNNIGLYIAPIIGLWGIFLLCYRILWQFLGFDRVFRKKKIDKCRTKDLIKH